MRTTKRTQAGEALTNLILDLFRLNSLLLTEGDRLVAGLGLTSARWQILGAIVAAERPQPVAWLARMRASLRTLGPRQSPERAADRQRPATRRSRRIRDQPTSPASPTRGSDRQGTADLRCRRPPAGPLDQWSFGWALDQGHRKGPRRHPGRAPQTGWQ